MRIDPLTRLLSALVGQIIFLFFFREPVFQHFAPF